MRNFTNDLLSASRPDIKMPFKASEFSWSILRYKLFNRCRRAYFIRYYLAQGGWDEYAHPLARSAYYEKYMLTLDQWMSQAFQKSVISAIRKAIIQQQEKQRRKDFAIHMLRGLSKSVSMLQSSLKNEEYLDDPKKPSVQEYVLEPKVYPDLNDLIAKTVNTGIPSGLMRGMKSDRSKENDGDKVEQFKSYLDNDELALRMWKAGFRPNNMSEKDVKEIDKYINARK